MEVRVKHRLQWEERKVNLGSRGKFIQPSFGRQRFRQDKSTAQVERLSFKSMWRLMIRNAQHRTEVRSSCEIKELFNNRIVFEKKLQPNCYTRRHCTSERYQQKTDQDHQCYGEKTSTSASIDTHDHSGVVRLRWPEIRWCTWRKMWEKLFFTPISFGHSNSCRLSHL